MTLAEIMTSNFRDRRTARAYASLGGAVDMHVVGPDMTCYEPGFEG